MNPAPPSGTAAKQPPPRRRPQSTNPLVAKRRPPPKNKPAPRPGGPSQQLPITQQANGASQKQQSTPAGQSKDQNPARTTAEFAQARRSPTPEGKPTIFKVKMTKRALLDGLRYHVVRMQSKENVNVLDESEYTRPIKLYRRDPTAQPVSGSIAAASPAETDIKVQVPDEAHEKEKERIEAIKAERQRIKEENLKQIAPAASKKKFNAFKKKTEQVYRTNETAEEVKRSQLRYEESLPWHLEDFDNKHTWVGAYEATLSDSYIMLVLESDHFRVVPLEKWYRFKERGNFKHISSEEAEALMKKKAKEPRWLLLQRQKEQEKKVIEKESTRVAGLFVRSGEKEAGEGVEARLDGDDAPDDELDFDDKDLFDDDDGDQAIEGDEEDQKHAENKIKREQLNANIFDMNDEKEVDEEENKKEEFEKEQKKSEKATRKALMQHEKNFTYEDSDDGNPYSSESEREDSDAESAAPSDQPQAPGSTGKSSQPKAPNGGGSGASTMGENTPSGRKKGGADALLHRVGLKRPGSPDLSEASGNESTVQRKKTKLDNGPSGVNASKLAAKLRAGDDLSGASGTESSRKKDAARQKKPTVKGGPSRTLGAGNRIGGAGSGSESESLRTSKLAQRSGTAPRDNRSGGVSPAHNSRAGSPSAGSQGPGRSGSRSGSPVAAPAVSLPSEAEIIAAIPPGGIDLTVLIKEFQSRIPKEGRTQFITLVRRISHFDKVSKKLFRKTE